MRVAIVHDWLTGMRGGERVLEALLELFPDAEIFTLLHVRGSVSDLIEGRPIHTSFLQSVPLAGRHYRRLLPLFPRAVASLDVRGFDLVLSSSHCVAKGVRVPPGVPHICYSHTPMRYVWDQQKAYFGPGRAGAWVRLAMAVVAPRLRAWDVRTARSVDHFVANSRWVAARIRRCYGRDAAVVFPPVELDRFAPTDVKDDFYLALGSPAPYKRMDVAVEAFRCLDRRLVVVGEGVTRSLAPGRKAARLPNVTFLERLPDPDVAALLGRARALLMPGAEDFGITAVEALASGTPVIALGEGGVLDTVTPASDAERGGAGATGVFFPEATPGALRDAIHRFELETFDARTLTEAARPFARSVFLDGMRNEVERVLAGEASREASGEAVA
jgi:glycosyltransferase involved in cell wall biosynthesis